MKLDFKKYILPIYLTLLLLPLKAFALELDYPAIPTPMGPFDLNVIVEGGGFTVSSFVFFIYAAAIWVGGILAFLILVYIAFTYILGGYSASSRNKAKKKLTDVLWGLMILLFATVILNTINPAIELIDDPDLYAVSPGDKSFQYFEFEGGSITFEGTTETDEGGGGGGGGTGRGDNVTCSELCLEAGNDPSICSKLNSPPNPCPFVACPVGDPHTYIDSWLACREGLSIQCSPSCSGCNRDHMGVDIMAPRGTPVYAYEGGTARRVGWGGGFAGNRFYLDGNSGNTYLYLHLDSFAPVLQAIQGTSGTVQVTAGQLVAYVGNTGATWSDPHVHWEAHPPNCSSSSCSCQSSPGCYQGAQNPTPLADLANCTR